MESQKLRDFFFVFFFLCFFFIYLFIYFYSLLYFNYIFFQVFLFRERLSKLDQKTANQYEYLSIKDNNGFVIHKPG